MELAAYIFYVFSLDFAVRLFIFKEMSKLQLGWQKLFVFSGLVGLIACLLPQVILLLEPIFLFLVLGFLRPRWTFSQYLFFGLIPFVIIDLFQRMTGVYEIKLAVLESVPGGIEGIIFILLGELTLLIFYYFFIKILRIDLQNIIQIFRYPSFKRLILILNISMVFYAVILHSILVLSGTAQSSSLTFNLGDIEVVIDLLQSQLWLFVGSIIYFNFKMKEILNKELQESKEQQLSALSSYSQHVESLYKDIRSFRHDYTNILVSLNEAFKQDDLDMAKGIYETVIADSDKKFYDSKYDIANLSHLENTAMKSIISAKLMEAQQLGIDLTVEIAEPISQPDMDLLDVVTILSIFLDNAIEAAQEAENPSLALAYFQENHQKILLIENSTQAEKVNTKAIFNYGKSSKGDNRGIGLANVKEILDRYPGVSLMTTSQNYNFRQEIRF
ncbi:two-component system, AgrA family, sensor histidine kinase AgrC [Streptococcus henryi]|uniref:Two-component system, AgrA family, sensor histidine kinase AgrC n=1 Tax=Streptococcus henryi TaxID=439219 RepID=A0A1G6BJY8_9STRE|nr:sensor histidine kinase [Streptococcus henryi]SDB20898.1 two-component system, AgrA family, sensor histidine kinase AgrC [Streptococcus henryi]